MLYGLGKLVPFSAGESLGSRSSRSLCRPWKALTRQILSLETTLVLRHRSNDGLRWVAWANLFARAHPIAATGKLSLAHAAHQITWVGVPVGLLLLTAIAGCARPHKADNNLNRTTLERRAMEYLTAAVRYQANPVVRVEAVEALESSGCDASLPWIRAALLDDHPAIRFAACVAVGRCADSVALESVRKCVDDQDASVQVAALFALHHLGQTRQTGRIPTYLLNHEDVTVRRNAALILGLLDEPSAVKVLARAMRDRDAGVRQHALEAMARLGNREARQELVFMTNAGIGSEEVFAIGALAGTGDPVYVDTLRYKLSTATHLETRLAAARGLGRLGSDEGLETALKALRTRKPLIEDPNDPPAGQILRVRQMAAAALGVIGRAEALPHLGELMEDPDDPRLQVSAARAILEILAADRERALPFGATE